MNPLSSLGIGSNVLNYDVIDKLRKADENAQIAPIDRKIQSNIEKQTELIGLKTMLSSLNASARKVADYSTYLGRNATTSDESKLKARVNSGVPTQDINIKINELAKNSVNEVGKRFAQRSDNFTRNNTTLSFYLKGQEYSIAISSTDTLDEVAQKIIDGTNGAVIASIMKTGSGANAYSLMINSKDSGEENNIYFGSVLESNEVPSGDFALNEGDFSVSLITSNGMQKTINVILPQISGGNANTLKNAILDALKGDADFADLVASGKINIALSADGKRILLNDARGFEISVSGAKAKSLFNEMIKTERDTLVGKSAIESGKISGVVTIGTENIDFGAITSAGNSAKDNESAIISAINKIEGYAARITNEGFLAINSNKGEVIIRASEDNKDALKKLGIEAGEYRDFGTSGLDITNIQRASNANFSYNGINISRPSNTIDDVVSGVTLELLGTSEDNITVNISQNNAMIIDEIKAFVESYNLLIPKLEELTRYDEDTKIAGIFNGNSDIRVIKGNLRRALGLNRFEDGRNINLSQFGLSFNDDGRLILDEAKLQSEISANSERVMDFFRTSKTTIAGKEVERDGVFSLVEKELDALIGMGDSRLKLFEETLKSDDKRLKDERKKNLEMLNSRYEIMANRFAAYDSQIAKVNNSFNHLNMLIEQSIADKRK